MTDTLKEQIEARKKQAEDRDIFYKASRVARRLGEQDYWAGRDQSDHDQTTTVHVFDDPASELKIVHSDTEEKDPEAWDSSSVKITYKGKEVFNGSCYGLNSYIPGAWESKLNALEAKSEEVLKKEQAAAAKIAAERKQAADKAERAKWGLDDAADASSPQASFKKSASSEAPRGAAQANQEALKKIARRTTLKFG